MSDRIIRASEIGQYDYCAKAWWLGSIEEVPPSNVHDLQAGLAAHEAHGRLVYWATRMQQIASGLLVLGAILLAVFLITSGL